MKRVRKRSLSWAMVFCMVISLFGGGVTDSTGAKAESASTEAKIVTNDKEIGDGYFYYPDLTVTLSSDTEVIHTLSVSVDSGFIQVSSLTLKDQNGVAQTGEGILYATGYDEDSSFTELKSTSVRYEALKFESSAGFTAAATQEFLRTLHFSTESVKTTNGQTIKITATTLSDEDMVLTVGDTQIQLYYFNGHFYGYVPASAFSSDWRVSWIDSYNEASSLKFKGVQGYLMTLTSRAEDRFVLSTFVKYKDGDNTYAKEGWMGCTRETLENVENGTAGENLPKMTSVGEKNPDSNFEWRWVTGPEKGQVFGVQTYADGSNYDFETNTTLECGNPDNGDGGFYTYNGCFSNWGNTNHVEPNGGARSDEAFGFYGKYANGRWNDNTVEGNDTITAFYIEFGGQDGDEEIFKENMNTITIEVTDNITSLINPDVDNSTLPITGVPVISNENEDGNVVGAFLKLTDGTLGVEETPCTSDKWDEDEYGTVSHFKSSLSYQWYVIDPETNEATAIKGATSSEGLTLTEDLLNKKVYVEVKGDGKEYSGTVTSKTFDTTETVKELTKITGHPTISAEDDTLTEGTKLTADVSKVGPDAGATEDLSYQWYVKDPDSDEWTPIEDANDKYYVLTEDDLGKDIKLTVTGDADDGYTGSADSNWISVPEAEATPTPAVTAVTQKTISGKPVIKNTDEDNQNKVGTVLEADTSNVKGSDGETPTLSYQWYVKNEDGSLTPIDGATDKTLTLTEDTLDKDLVAAVTGTGDYTGTRNSNPYTAAEEKIDITGTPVIVNETKDTDGNEIVRKGTILYADVDKVDPEGSHDTLTYQWYIDKGDGNGFVAIDGATAPRYTMAADDFYIGEGDDKTITVPKLKVEVTGNGKYQGTLESEPVEEARTDSDISLKEDETDSTKRLITLTPTQDNTIYGIKLSTGEVINPPCVDQDGNEVQPNVYDGTYDGYYRVNVGETLTFTVDKDKEYIISEIHQEKISYLVVSPDIDTDTITKTDYDNNGTPGDNTDDTISITVDPTDQDLQYAILKEEDGKYVPVTITYNKTTGQYESDPDSDNMYSNGGDSVVTFTGLPADGTYKVVAIESGTTPKDVIGMEIDASQIQGGSKDVTFEADPIVGTNTGSVSSDTTPAPATTTPDSTPVATDDTSASTSKPDSDDKTTEAPASATTPAVPTTSATAGSITTAQPTGAPGGSTSTTLTTEEESQVTKFIKDYLTDPTGNGLITEVTDLTRDLIVTGESDWNKLTSAQQDEVNRRLSEAGSPYTYQQLLEMAKAYKIPGFKLHKVMKVKTKAKLKLMKCKGATIVVTSTNKKVATVNKKGIIKAKKKGKAKLTITAVKGKYSNRLVVNIEVRKKFKNATELKKFKSNVIKTPTILIAKKRKLHKSTKIKIYGLEKDAKVQYKSYNKKALPINKKGKYTAKKKGKSLMRVIVKQNDKKYFLYLYVTAFKKGGKKK